LLHLDDPDGRTPWLDWRSWLADEAALEASRADPLLPQVPALVGDPPAASRRRAAGKR
jgi:hypothetical protein